MEKFRLKLLFVVSGLILLYTSVTLFYPATNLSSTKFYNRMRQRHFQDIQFYRKATPRDRQSNVRLLCMIFTYPKNINKTLAVKNTWLKRCDGYLFFSNFTLPGIPTALLNVTESRNCLAKKTRLAFQYVYDHKYLDEFDWFLKADDDVYIIIENLKSYLSLYDPNEKMYLGRKLSKFKGDTYYMSGGAGYVLSKTAVQTMIQKCFQTMQIYFKSSIEDMAVGSCALKYNFTAPDSRDSLGRERFHSFNPMDYVNDRLPMWITWYSVNPLKKGLEGCSNETISFHYINPSQMYLLEFYLYKIKVRDRTK